MRERGCGPWLFVGKSATACCYIRRLASGGPPGRAQNDGMNGLPRVWREELHKNTFLQYEGRQAGIKEKAPCQAIISAQNIKDVLI